MVKEIQIPPPKGHERSVETVLRQAKLMCEEGQVVYNLRGLILIKFIFLIQRLSIIISKYKKILIDFLVLC